MTDTAPSAATVAPEAGLDDAGRVDPRTRRQRLAGPLSAVGALAAGTLLVAVVDPNQPGHYPLCPTKWLTGIDCPGCGGLRATHDLAHGNIASAFSHNALFVILVPLIIFLLGRNIYSAWTGRPSKPIPPRLSRNLMIALAIATVAFTIVRNLPFGAYLGSS